MVVAANSLKAGMKIEVDGYPHMVVKSEFVKPGKGQPFVRMKMKNMLSSKMVEKTYKANLKFTLADINEINARFIYKNSEGFVFIDNSSYEEICVRFDAIKNQSVYMVEDTIYGLVLYNGEVIDVLPPTFVEMVIVERIVGGRESSDSGKVSSMVKTDTGANVMVPLSVKDGTRITVDTRDGTYVSKTV